MIKYFYWLVLLQISVIIFSFNLSIDPQCLDNLLINIGLKNFVEDCYENIIPIKYIASNIYLQTIWTNIPNRQHWGYLYIYPVMLILKQLNKEENLFRKIAFIFHWTSYPFQYLFVEKLSMIIKQYYSDSIMTLQIILGLFTLNLSLIIINQHFFKLNFSNKKKPLHFLFFLLGLNVLYNVVTVSNNNWAPYLIINAYFQVYLIHIDCNLFQKNKYNVYKKSLFKLLLQSLSFFDSNDEDHYQFENHFVVRKDKSFFIIIIASMIFYFKDILLQVNLLITISIILLIFFLLIYWDTSLVSTSSNLTLKDQWLAADLFFLDIFLPIRNLVMFLLLD